MSQTHPERCLHVERDGAPVYAVLRLTRRDDRDEPLFDDVTELCAGCTSKASAVVCGFAVEAC